MKEKKFLNGLIFATMTSILNFWVGLCQIKSYFLAEQPHLNARKSQFIHPETKKTPFVTLSNNETL